MEEKMGINDMYPRSYDSHGIILELNQENGDTHRRRFKEWIQFHLHHNNNSFNSRVIHNTYRTCVGEFRVKTPLLFNAAYHCH